MPRNAFASHRRALPLLSEAKLCLCRAERYFAFALRRTAAQGLCIALLRLALPLQSKAMPRQTRPLLCAAPPGPAVLLHFAPSESAKGRISPLSETPPHAIIEPEFYGFLQFRIETDNLNLYL